MGASHHTAPRPAIIAKMNAGFPIRYVDPVFRPPSEAESLILPVTDGCSWNKCTFDWYCKLHSIGIGGSNLELQFIDLIFLPYYNLSHA